MKEYTCPTTKTRIEYPEGATFKVFIRRSNSPMKLAKVTKDPQDAVYAYNSVKLFNRDRAYIFVNGLKIIHRNGSEDKPYSLRGYKKPLNYRRKTFTTPNMPETVHSALYGLESIAIEGKAVSMSKIVILLASKFVSMDKAEMIDYLNSCIVSYKEHLIMSGCDNVDWVEDFLDSKNENIEEDLL
jgi:hypothetical protein